MRQLMCQQMFSTLGLRGEFPFAEVNIVAVGKCPGVHIAAQLHSFAVGMYIDTTEIRSETAFHKMTGVARQRSEEHTSELQSLMRSSYAVFCLIKKKEKKSNEENQQ